MAFLHAERADSKVNFYGSSFVSYCPAGELFVCVVVVVIFFKTKFKPIISILAG